MHKYVMAVFLALGLSVSAYAVQSIPKGTDGGPLEPKYAGVSSCEITSTTGTAAVLCTSGSGIILDVFASSVATTDSIVIRDSATANTSSAVLFSVDKNSLDKALRIYPRFNNGLSVNATVAPTAPLIARPDWIVIYNKDLK